MAVCIKSVREREKPVQFLSWPGHRLGKHMVVELEAGDPLQSTWQRPAASGAELSQTCPSMESSSISMDTHLCLLGWH